MFVKHFHNVNIQQTGCINKKIKREKKRRGDYRGVIMMSKL